MDDIHHKRLGRLIRHIENVQADCRYLGDRLISTGSVELGREIIANGMIHDNSKFHGIEWLYFHADVKEEMPKMFQLAYAQHVKVNRHHPEAWYRGISSMTDPFIGEMVADWHARGSEFGTNFWEWVDGPATERFGFEVGDKTYDKIKFFADILLEERFN